MITSTLGKRALSVEFDTKSILYGIHKHTVYGKNYKQTGVMIFGLIIVYGIFM